MCLPTSGQWNCPTDVQRCRALWITSSLRIVTLYAFVIWIAVAFVWYLVYARSHSHLGRHEHVGLAAGEETPL